MTDPKPTFDPIQALKDRGDPVPEPVTPTDATPLTDAMIAEMDDPLDLSTFNSLDAKHNPSEVPLALTGTEKGIKLDTGKLPVWRGMVQYFGKAMLAVAAISEFGSRKYTWGGWKTVPEGEARYSDAMMRHFLEESQGELYDPETGMLHAAHAAWGANARLQLMLDRGVPLHKPD